MKNIFAALAILLFFAASAVAAGIEITPFRAINQSPMSQIFGLPVETGTDITSYGKVGTVITQDIASNYTIHSNSRESIVLDAESYRWTVAARYGIGEQFEVGVEIPYILIGGGFLDSFVIDWHNFFQLPQGGRNKVTNDRLLVSYYKDGITKMKFDHAGSGVGDISLTGGMKLYDDQVDNVHRVLTLRTTLKLPSGDSGSLRGSGSADFNLLLCGSINNYTEWGTLGLFGSVGGMVMSNGNILADQQKNHAVFGNIGAGWAPAEWISFKVQLNMNSPFYRGSSIKELTGTSMMLVSGGSIKLPDDYLLDIGVSEDVAVATAPDVAFHLGLSKRF
jgi:hypothetical protein